MPDDAAPEEAPARFGDERPIRWLPGLMEAGASLTALVAMGALLRNKVRTELTFFGEIPEVTSEHVATYRLWLVVLGVAVAASFATAFRRRRPLGRSVRWHGLVLVLGVAVAVLSHVSI